MQPDFQQSHGRLLPQCPSDLLDPVAMPPHDQVSVVRLDRAGVDAISTLRGAGGESLRDGQLHKADAFGVTRFWWHAHQSLVSLSQGQRAHVAQLKDTTFPGVDEETLLDDVAQFERSARPPQELDGLFDVPDDLFVLIGDEHPQKLLLLQVIVHGSRNEGERGDVRVHLDPGHKLPLLPFGVLLLLD